jgi:hypothetical protein
VDKAQILEKRGQHLNVAEQHESKYRLRATIHQYLQLLKGAPKASRHNPFGVYRIDHQALGLL